MELKGCPMKKLLALFVILTVAADAAEYKWIGGENGSWQSDKSFEPNGNPGGEDDVLLPANVVVKLNFFRRKDMLLFLQYLKILQYMQDSLMVLIIVLKKR
jgi:hypothetical protein